MSHTCSIKVLKGETIYGPFNYTQIQKLIKVGRLIHSDMVSIDGSPWVPLSQVLKPQLGIQQQVTPTNPIAEIISYNSKYKQENYQSNDAHSEETMKKDKSVELNDLGINNFSTETTHNLQSSQYQQGGSINQANNYVSSSSQYQQVSNQYENQQYLVHSSLSMVGTPLNLGYLLTVGLSIISLLFPWYGASGSFSSSDIGGFNVNFNLIGILYFPWGPMSLMLGIASIIIFLIFPHKIILLSVSLFNLLVVLSCSLMIFAIPSISATSNVDIGGVGVSAYAGFGFTWGYWVSLATGCLSSIYLISNILLSPHRLINRNTPF
ncbi:MAG: hypothetical protein FJ261_00975 [Planctomycetes bacterium]|nr:hypothetical protein [Planctomycetota bacterium]